MNIQSKRLLATSTQPFLASLPQAGSVITNTATKYAGRYTVTLIPGDGIGVELADSVKAIFTAVNAPIDFEQYDISGYKQDKENETKMKAAIDSLRRNKVGLKGILHTPVSRFGATSLNVSMRKDLDIFASVALIKNVPNLKARHQNVDFAIIRENTEGEYSGLEHQPVNGVVESLKIITRQKSERIARFAFDFALKNGRKKVTCVHKANIMKLADGLFLNTCRDVAKLYENSGVQFEEVIVDNCAMQLVAKPQQFDVMVMPNLYGSIVSNVGAALVGGVGLVPGANVGRDYAVFEPGCRHVGKDIQGRNLANPTSMILSSVMMLRHLGLEVEAERISSAVMKVLSQGKALTADLGGQASTTDFTKSVIESLD
ncbi:hypothetical protein MIR68_002659 [Amoeboaphelidium protococcarum]|nr:hypothetical protein MIR68_002659 [Amoeboaphelidium protococcarum]KAI3653192.1 hypothetical protein MP228_002617 [Amoeboaphelidium protococcarum]KAI3653806.1 hypothetical protein MP228_001753 [Amoeboaphelidium protococcarum]